MPRPPARGAACSELAIACRLAARLIGKDSRVILILGTRKLERLRESFGAANVAITAEEIASIDAKLDTMEFDVFGGHAAK